MTKPTDAAPDLAIAWCAEPALADAIAAFFVGHVDAAYISHQELQEGRAVAPGQWHAELDRIIRDEVQAILAGPGQDRAIAIARAGGAMVGLALVSFRPVEKAPGRYAVVDDLIVSPAARGLGLGRHLVDWIAAEARARGATRLFLESGIHNDRAHAFFEKQGFARLSTVMLREL
ncbi:GNAT family N-acetyltransferase [Phreatobacter stygius]|uniref:GNAT family N-acetyltransferase n=1 Tax=Phreatobacter stygius TaxID=1940610 RepID=A0A4D7BJH4_9HYPH|nr:GNAT family N-acetyltransferase [Phreatobacter stygius]QCI67857.1 GNAT family N-acetyltransferase [Phreatobacter stygius]